MSKKRHKTFVLQITANFSSLIFERFLTKLFFYITIKMWVSYYYRIAGFVSLLSFMGLQFMSSVTSRNVSYNIENTKIDSSSQVIKSKITSSTNTELKSSGLFQKNIVNNKNSSPLSKTLPHSEFDGIKTFVEFDEDNVLELEQIEQLNQEQIKAPTSDPKKSGETFSAEFHSSDKAQAIKVLDKTVRSKTVNMRYNELNSKKNYILSKIDSSNSEKSDKLIGEIDIELSKQHELAELEQEYASTDSSRNIFVKKGAKAKEEYVPLLANLHNQKVEINGIEKSSVNRSAAVSDFTHGETNLLEMQSYELLDRIINSKEAKTTPAEIIKSNEKLWELLKSLHDLESNSSLDTVKISKVMQGMKNQFKESYGSEFNFSDERLFSQSLSAAITQRRERLESLFLQDLVTHLESGGVKLINDNTLCMGRIALVDTTKAANPGKEDGSVFVLNERNQALDMQAIYAHLEGKTLKFDGDAHDAGAFMDPFDSNVIHLPKRLAQGNKEELKLKTSYINVSVCCNTKNEGAQEGINKEGLESLTELIKLLPEAERAAASILLEELKESLTGKKKCNFATADKVVQLMAMLGTVSIDCYGGKDRTGYLLATITGRIAKDALMDLSAKDSSYNAKSDLVRLKNWLMSEEGIAKKIVLMNTGHTAIKLMTTPKNLPLFTTATLIAEVVKVGKVMTGVTPLQEKDSKAAYSEAATAPGGPSAAGRDRSDTQSVSYEPTKGRRMTVVFPSDEEIINKGRGLSQSIGV